MPESKPQEQRTGLIGLPMFVAVGAVIVWVIFVVVMMTASTTDEVRWARLSFVFGLVEAIAFAAAGALFGVTVQRDRVEKAEAKAEANARDAANGRALAVMAVSDDTRIMDKDSEGVFEKFGPADAKESDARRVTPTPHAACFLTYRAGCASRQHVAATRDSPLQFNRATFYLTAIAA